MAGGKCILVVEDDPVFRDLLVDWLVAAGYAVERAAEGAAAIERVRSRLPALVVTDIRMPGTDGSVVIREVGRLGYGVPVIAISGHFDAESGIGRDEARVLGAAITLAKPFERREFVAAVRRFAGPPDS